MSVGMLLRILFAMAIAAATGWELYRQHGADKVDETSERQRYLPFFSGLPLPGVLLIYAVAAPAMGIDGAWMDLLSLTFSVVLLISVYYLLLLPLLPLLRRHFSALACAALWMVPNYLYVTQIAALPSSPLVLRVPVGLAGALLALWAAGAAAVMLWKIGGHLRFRARILRGAQPVNEERVLAVWNAELEAARLKKPKFRLVRAPEAKTPLSVGLFRRTIRVVLPQRDYTDDELALIFRHELIHISREDAWAKFFFAFCTAVCWFNPLVWLAVRRSADDLELSCDESVLRESDPAQRRRYAELLLSQAGGEQGFTTCLSVKAKALRYRLKNVVQPKRKLTGAILVSVVLFGLCMSGGYVTLAFEGADGRQVFYDGGDGTGYELMSILRPQDEYVRDWHCTDEQALREYLADMQLARVTSQYAWEESDREMMLLLNHASGWTSITLYDDVVKWTVSQNERLTAQYYLVPGGVDWETLDALLWADPALEVRMHAEKEPYPRSIGASLRRLEVTRGGATELLFDNSDTPETPSGVIGAQADRAELDFSMPVRDFTVTVTPMDGTESTRLSRQALADPQVLPLADYAARYTVEAQLEQGDAHFTAVFQFDFEPGE